MTEVDHPILVDKRDVARMTTLSVRTIDRLVSTGRFPPPLRLGRKSLWHRGKLEVWLAGGGDPAHLNDAENPRRSPAKSP